MSSQADPKGLIRPSRTVVSYVRRSPRMNPTQEKALARGREKFGIPLASGQLETSIAEGQKIDFDQAFGRRSNRLIVEIGCGVGDSLWAMAANRPDASVIAFEVFLRGVARTFLALEHHEVSHVRVIEADGAQGLEKLFAPGQLAEVWTFFPDPWQKKRHHKRRLINQDFAQLVAERLTVNGLWRIATDWDDYAEQISAQVGQVDELKLVATDRADRPVTRFEQRGIDAGRKIHEFVYQRKPAESE